MSNKVETQVWPRLHRPLCRKDFLLVVVFGLPALFPTSQANATLHEIALSDAIEQALANSPTARRLALQSRRNEANYHYRQRERLPQLHFGLQAPMLSQEFNVESLPGTRLDTLITGDGDTTTVLQQVFGRTTTTRRNAAGDLRFRQILPWRGTLYANSSVFYRDESTDPVGIRSSRLDYTLNAQVGLDVQLLGDDPERNSLQRSLTEYEIALARERAATAQLRFETVTRYLTLLRGSLTLAILNSALDQGLRAAEQAENKVASGLIPEVELLRIRVLKAEREAQMAEAETRFARESDAFKAFLGFALSDSIRLMESLTPFDPEVDLQQMLQLALDHRTEIGIGKREIELLEMDRLRRRPYRPDLSLSLRYGGAASEATLDQSIESLSANNLSLQIRLDVPLWDAGRAGLEEESELLALRVREVELQDTRTTIELEVRDAVRQLRDALRRHDLLQVSTRLANETLRISSERFDRGLIDTDSYLLAQAEAASARLGATGALLDLYMARARLELVTLQPFEEWKREDGP